MPDQHSRRAWLRWSSGGIAASLTGCLRLTQQEGSESQREGSAELQEQTDSTERESEFEIELVSAWNTDSLTDVVSAGGDFFINTFDRIQRIRPDGSTIFETTVIDDDDYFAEIEDALHVSGSGVYIGATPSEENEDTNGARMYALDPTNGETQWTSDEPADGLHTDIQAVTRTADTIIYASMSDGSASNQEPIVRSLNADTGREQWQITLESSFITKLFTYENRLFVQQTFELLEYNIATQERVDSYDLGVGFKSPVERDGTLYVPSSRVQALRLPSLDTVWEADTEYDIGTQPSLGSTGVFYGTEAGFIVGYNLETGEQLWENRVSGVVSRHPVVADGLVWVGSERGGLSAYTERTGERVYQRDIAPDFTFAIQGGTLVTTESGMSFEIREQ